MTRGNELSFPDSVKSFFRGDLGQPYQGFPTELQKISSALKKIEDTANAQAEKIQPLFITVDPERDTPAVMREYVSLFHPRLIGLSGSQAQIDVVKKNYRIYSAKVQSEISEDYSVDHSSFIYFMGPDDAVLGIYRTADDADMIAKDILAIMQRNGE